LIRLTEDDPITKGVSKKEITRLRKLWDEMTNDLEINRASSSETEHQIYLNTYFRNGKLGD